MILHVVAFFFFFFNDTATTEIYTLSLHDALPISLPRLPRAAARRCRPAPRSPPSHRSPRTDRKSTRLNSSHGYISYAVFCLKKKKKYIIQLYISELVVLLSVTSSDEQSAVLHHSA